MDFTLKMFSNLCNAISNSKYRTVTVNHIINIMDEIALDDHYIILRHDVDRFPRQAEELAKIEKDFGLDASFYFRIPASYDDKIIANISEMGHEVGLHYECVDKARGNIRKAVKILEHELSMLNKLCKTNTVSMHGNPLTKFDNRVIWQHYDYKQFDLNGEVYLSMNFEKLMYYSDTGRTWEDGKYNIKDIIPKNMASVSDKPVLKKTDDLIELINNDVRNIYLLIHPERWSGSYIGWTGAFVKDVLFNYAKLLIKGFRD